MCEPVAEMVRESASKDLRFIFQPAKRPRIHHAVTITLKVVAVSVFRLRIASSAALFRTQRIRSKHEMSVAQRSYKI